MQLFFAKDTVARVSLIVLEEIGASYEAVRVDFGVGGQRQAAYLAVNPKGRVPALVTGEGVLTETPAILSYLAARFAPARLMPEALFAAAQVQEVCAYLCSTVHVAHAHRVRGARWSDDPAVIAGAVHSTKKPVPCGNRRSPRQDCSRDSRGIRRPHPEALHPARPGCWHTAVCYG